MRSTVIPFKPTLRYELAANIERHSRREQPLEGVAAPPSRSSSSTATPRVTATTPSRSSRATSTGSPPMSRARRADGGRRRGAAFLLCRRAAKLSAHAGQWALPGGRCDGGETAPQAALRELHEELGLHLDEGSVLGLLDDYATRSGYVITPVVVWGGGDVDLVPTRPRSRTPIGSGCTSCAAPILPASRRSPRATGPVVQVPLGGDLIHAPTGAMLVQFRWVAIEGRLDERVDHFEQPVFAWR